MLPLVCVNYLRLTPSEINYNVSDKCVAEESKIQAHHGANGEHGKRSQVQCVQRTFGRQVRNHTLWPVDRPNVCIQRTEENKER